MSWPCTAMHLVVTSANSQCARNPAYRLSAARQIFGKGAQVSSFTVDNALKAAELLSPGST